MEIYSLLSADFIMIKIIKQVITGLYVARSAQPEVRVELHPSHFYYGLINGFLFFGFIFHEPK